MFVSEYLKLGNKLKRNNGIKRRARRTYTEELQRF